MQGAGMKVQDTFYVLTFIDYLYMHWKETLMTFFSPLQSTSDLKKVITRRRERIKVSVLVKTWLAENTAHFNF